MKVALILPLVTIFATAASAFGLNGGATSMTKTHKALISKSPMVQPVDVQGNRLSSVVSKQCLRYSGDNYVV